MSIQNLIDSAQSLQIDRRKVSNMQVTRSGRVKTSQLASAQPWIFRLEASPGIKYSTNRAMLEELDRLDRIIEETINIGQTNPGLAYLVDYKGEFTAAQRANITISSFDAANSIVVLNLTNTGLISNGAYLFRKGDYFQPSGGYRYPLTVTADVLRGPNVTVSVPTHRPAISQTGYTPTNQNVLFGTQCTWRVKLLVKPVYNIVPYDRIEFSETIQLVEVIL